MDKDSGEAPAESRLLLRVALVIFTVTVAIGIFNGFHFLTLSRAVLLTHVHAGTLGWITISAFAVAYWAFGGGPRWIAIAFAIAVPLYVLGFLSGNLPIRAITGTPVLLIILALVGSLYMRVGGAGITTPRLGMLLALTVLVIGSTLGVLIQIQLATSNNFLPDTAVIGHVAAQVGGYLVLFALSTIDWRLAGTNKLGIGGAIQVVMFFLGGILIAVGGLFNIQPLLASFIPLDIIALVIFLVRVGPKVVGAPWGQPTGSRHYAIAVPWLVTNLAITIYFIQLGIRAGSFDGIPPSLFVAADHAIFLGVMTNLVFGLLHDVTAEQSHIMPWTENVTFYVMNLALVGFVVSLIAQAQWAEKFFVPFQGIAILVGIVAYSMRLAEGQGGPAAATPAVAGGD